MTATWKFYEQQATDPIRNPIAGEFFATEAVGNVAEALVREGMQNTLDARRKKDHSREPASVRIFISEAGASLSARQASRWFGSLTGHVNAPNNGLRDQPKIGDPCPFLVFEDFGTTGLTGDPAAHQIEQGRPNNFLNFFRAEGHSDKGEQDRGSWGVGKTVFPRASRISSFIGFTVRHDDGRQLLLGHSVLKYHRAGSKVYKSDGYLGVARDDGFMLPTDDPGTLAEFRTDFRVKRQDEPGLTIVVPWYETEGGVDRDGVIEAVLRGFFYPILMGHLSVTIATPSGEVFLDQTTIIKKVEGLGGELALHLLPVLELAEWARTRTPNEFLTLNPPPEDVAQTWSSTQVDSEVGKAISTALALRQRLAIRVPMTVSSRRNGLQRTFFDIFLEHSDEDSERPRFIRDELIILDVKSPKTPNVRSIVIVEDPPLATLLRDAETPAHTQWNQDTSNFKNKYKYGAGAIKFVRFGVFELIRILNQAEQQPDPAITIDFFSIPAPDDSGIPGHDLTPGNRPKVGPRPGVPVTPGEPRPRRFHIDRLPGGFVVRPGNSDALPQAIDIKVAYDVRRGSALKRYDPADFDLASAPIHFDPENKGVSVLSVHRNRLIIAIESQDFSFGVSGFDPDRDLYVRADAREGDDASPTN